MDRRRELRFESNTPVQVAVLGPPLGQAIEGRILNLSGRGLQLLLPRSIQPGTALRIDQGAQMLLGEAVYCSAEAGGYVTGVEIQHAVLDVPAMERLRKALSDQGSETDSPATLK
jgi:PilZ domain